MNDITIKLIESEIRSFISTFLSEDNKNYTFLKSLEVSVIDQHSIHIVFYSSHIKWFQIDPEYDSLLEYLHEFNIDSLLNYEFRDTPLDDKVFCYLFDSTKNENSNHYSIE